MMRCGRRHLILLVTVLVLSLLPVPEAAHAEPVISVTDGTFAAQVLASTTPVLVDFWAEWCGPCRTLAPMLAQIADEQAGKLRVARLNVDENPRTPQRFAVGRLPTLLLFEAGQPVQRIEGPTSKQEILAALARPGGDPAPGPGAAAGPIVVTDAQFRAQVLESPTPVLLALWAPWCGPCRQMAPELEQLAAETAGVLTVARLNVDENPQVPGALAIETIPSALLFRDGRLVEQIDGFRSKQELVAELGRHIPGLQADR